MKNTFKRIGTLLLVCMMVFTMSATAFAATNATPSIKSSFTFDDKNWTDIATCSTGLGCTIFVRVNTTSAASFPGRVPVDLRMLDKNGNELWSTTLSGNGTTYNFECGSDVYKVQVKSQYSTGYGSAGRVGS